MAPAPCAGARAWQQRKPGTYAPAVGWSGRGRSKASQMIRKIKAGYRLYSRKKNPRTGRRRNLGTFKTKKAAEKHEREVQYFKGH
jgi:hypothetical protein